MSKLTLNGEPQPWLQDILDRHFSEHHLRSEDIQRIEIHAHVMDFPRSLWYLHAIAGKTVIITTATDTYFAELPGDPDTFKHVLRTPG